MSLEFLQHHLKKKNATTAFTSLYHFFHTPYLVKTRALLVVDDGVSALTIGC